MDNIKEKNMNLENMNFEDIAIGIEVLDKMGKNKELELLAKMCLPNFCCFIATLCDEYRVRTNTSTIDMMDMLRTVVDLMPAVAKEMGEK